MGVSSKMSRIHQALCLLVLMRERDSNLFHFGGDIQKFPVAWHPQKHHRNNTPLHFPLSGTPVLYRGIWSTLYYPISDISSVYHQPDITACSVGDTGDLGSIPGGDDPLEEENGKQLQYFSWKSPWTEEPGRLQSSRKESDTAKRLHTSVYHFYYDHKFCGL